MKCALVTAHNDRCKELADITFTQNKVLYCQKYNYPLFAKTSGFRPNIPPHFEKIHYTLEVLKSNPDLDWVWWLDTDTMITNFGNTIEQFCDNNYDVVIANEVYNWYFNNIDEMNTGSFFIKNSPLAHKILQTVIDQERNFYDSLCFDQTCMIEMYYQNEEFRKATKFFPFRAFNSHYYTYWDSLGHSNYSIPGRIECCQWHPGDFVIHWAAMPMDVRIQYAKEMLPRVIK